MSLSDLLGDEIEDPDEEHFRLFSTSIPTSNLGFISSTSPVLTVTVGSTDLTIHQSPGLLSSTSVPSGTTGAVLWKITPLIAEWLARPDNFLFPNRGILRSSGPSSSSSSAPTDDENVGEPHILELGCGIAGVIALTLQRRVARYIATDLAYVIKGLKRNLRENGAWPDAGGDDDETTEIAAGSSGRSGPGKKGQHQQQQQKGKGGRKSSQSTSSATKSTTAAKPRKSPGTVASGVIEATDLDWAESTPSLIRARIADAEKINLILACDCIYNESLVDAFVQTCVDASSLSLPPPGGRPDAAPATVAPPICLVAQQLRSDLVFEAWLRAFHARFHTWRVPDELLTEELRMGSGYVVHVGVLRRGEEGRWE